jgi:class 3 adenylate cyclase/HEAT repeat protein
MNAPSPAAPKPAVRTPASLGREGRVTALTLLKSYYDEEIFNLLVKPIYDADLAVSEAAIRASGSPGNEVAVKHLYQIIERGKKSQRLAAIQSLAEIRAPSSVGMLIRYFNHFSGEDDVRTAILGAMNAIAPSNPQVQELAQAVLVDARQSDEARRIAVETLVDTSAAFLLDPEKQPEKRPLLPKLPSSVQEAAFNRMLRSGVQAAPDFTNENLTPGPLGAYLCLYVLKADSKEQPQKQLTRQPARLLYQHNWVLGRLQQGHRQTVRSFLLSLTSLPEGRLRFPGRVLKLLLGIPFVDVETEGLVGDFLSRIVERIKKESPQLLTEFSESTANRLEKIFALIRQTYISVSGITSREELLTPLFASLLERYATPALLAEAQAYFRDESPNRAAMDHLRTLFAGAPREDRNYFEACLPLFQKRERKDRLAISNMLSRVDLNRPFELRRLNRLIRAAGVLEIRTSAHKILEVLEFARAERVPFLEETSVVTLCQLRTSMTEKPNEFLRDFGRSLRSLNGWVRGARHMQASKVIGHLVTLLLQPKLDSGTRALAVESLDRMNLSTVAKSLPTLLKTFDLEAIDEDLRLRIADVLAKWADAGIAHLTLDLTGSPSAPARRAAVRALRGLCSRGAGVSTDTLTERLYRLLEDADQSVRLESLLALLAINDDYAAQVVTDEAQAGRTGFVAELLAGLSRPLSGETFALVKSLLTLESAPVQAAIRSLASELCQGSYAEETRQVLVRSLVPSVGATVPAATAHVAAVSTPAGESIFAKSKLEFKFQRSYVQELTVLFVDIADYTKKTLDMKPKEIDDLVNAFEGKIKPNVYKNHGKVVKLMGDAILAVFKRPVNAVIAAMAIQQEIQQYSSMRIEQEKFQVRMGINTGQVTWKDNDIFGKTVNVASRMQTAANPGDILITDSTWKRVREHVRCTELGPIKVKGIEEAITSYSPEEILGSGQERDTGSGERIPVQAGSLERLRESMFEPEFRVPEGRVDRAGVDLLHELFGEIAQKVGDLLTDSQEYDFKKYLQDRWNDLMRHL